MLNRSVLIGRLTKDPLMKYTPNGKAVTNFTLAVDRSYKNANGEKETDFIPCVVWGKTAENVAEYLVKGSMAAVDGRIQVRSYEAQDGSKRWATEIVADNVRFLDSRKSKEQGGAMEIAEAEIDLDADVPF